MITALSELPSATPREAQRSDSEGTGQPCKTQHGRRDMPRREKETNFSMSGQPTLRQTWPRE